MLAGYLHIHLVRKDPELDVGRWSRQLDAVEFGSNVIDVGGETDAGLFQECTEATLGLALKQTLAARANRNRGTPCLSMLPSPLIAGFKPLCDALQHWMPPIGFATNLRPAPGSFKCG